MNPKIKISLNVVIFIIIGGIFLLPDRLHLPAFVGVGILLTVANRSDLGTAAPEPELAEVPE